MVGMHGGRVREHGRHRGARFSQHRNWRDYTNHSRYHQQLGNGGACSLRCHRIQQPEGLISSLTMYHLTIEAKDGTAVNWYEAKIWVKLWLNFQKLEDFKLADPN
jgi:hypothetical protein